MSERKKKPIRLKLPELEQCCVGATASTPGSPGGTYGVIFAGVDLKDNERPVAIKCLMPSAATSLAVVQRFQREIMVIRSISHPNVIAVYDADFSANGVLFYVMEYLSGHDLGARIKKGAISVKGAIGVGVQVLMALDHAHRKEVIHRDLKPENIYLQRSEEGRVRVRVLDFGIAKIVGERGEGLERLTLNNEACGTPNYMAPEQVTGGTIVPATDLYAMGLILHEMLTGKIAISGSSFVETLRMQMMVIPKLEGKLARHPIAKVLERSLQKKAADRYQCAGEMKDALLQAL